MNSALPLLYSASLPIHLPQDLLHCLALIDFSPLFSVKHGDRRRCCDQRRRHTSIPEAARRWDCRRHSYRRPRAHRRARSVPYHICHTDGGRERCSGYGHETGGTDCLAVQDPTDLQVRIPKSPGTPYHFIAVECSTASDYELGKAVRPTVSSS